MTGIYKLYWLDNPTFYIGQSLDIYHRHGEHCRFLKNNNHYSNKLQDTYNQYGDPLIMLLEQCSPDDLDHKEMQHITNVKDLAFCCNIVGAVPMRNVSFAISREEHFILSTIARDKGYPSLQAYLKAFTKHMVDNV